mmetsp:Transcript_14170/g.35092  ORF Transcript_14170/g.35092 Transcript_14170/m.35092 type:complete len:223 (+) Transcript_14170:3166-3834(+)
MNWSGSSASVADAMSGGFACTSRNATNCTQSRTARLPLTSLSTPSSPSSCSIASKLAPPTPTMTIDTGMCDSLTISATVASKSLITPSVMMSSTRYVFLNAWATAPAVSRMRRKLVGPCSVHVCTALAYAACRPAMPATSGYCGLWLSAKQCDTLLAGGSLAPKPYAGTRLSLSYSRSTSPTLCNADWYWFCWYGLMKCSDVGVSGRPLLAVKSTATMRLNS